MCDGSLTRIFPETSLCDKKLVLVVVWRGFRQLEYLEEGGATFCKSTKRGFVSQAKREEMQQCDPAWVH